MDIRQEKYCHLYILLQAIKSFCSDESGNLVDSAAEIRVWDMFKMVSVEFAAASCKFYYFPVTGKKRSRKIAESFGTAPSTPFHCICFLWTLEILWKRKEDYKARRKMERSFRNLEKSP